MHNTIRLLVILLLISTCWGCALVRFLQCHDKLMTLKRVGASQDEIGKYVERQEKLFLLLLDDIRNDRIKSGLSKTDVIDTYGDPILFREVVDRPSIKEALLYRHPTEYFSSDRVYLYFDDSGKLVYWEYKPHKE